MALASGCGDNLTEFPTRVRANGAGDDTPKLTCTPNLDGILTSDEVPTVLGVPTDYLISSPERSPAVDIQGQVSTDGIREWNWNDSTLATELLTVVAEPIAGAWYEGSFPDGQFRLALDIEGTVHAIYRRDSTGLYLLGFASSEESPASGKTLMRYSTAVLLYEFPFTVGKGWTSTGEIQGGTFNNLPYSGTDTYAVEVEALGRLNLPDFTFDQVYQVRTTTTVAPALGASTTVQQVSFFFECFGEVARATSQDNETDANFSNAAEVRHLGR